MQKFVQLSSITLALGLLAGCGSNAPDPSVDASAPPPPATVMTPAAPVPETFVPYVAAGEIAAQGQCSLDAINAGPAIGSKLPVGSDATFGGWMSDANGQVPAQAVLVLKSTDRAYSVALVAGGERPDVAVALNNEALKLSGYNVFTKLVGVEPGKYELSIVTGAGTAVSTCQLGGDLEVTP